MTDHVNGFLVILENDLREDDAAPCAEAIRHLRGVLDVRPIPADVAAIVARAQARGELVAKLGKALEDYV